MVRATRSGSQRPSTHFLLNPFTMYFFSYALLIEFVMASMSEGITPLTGKISTVENN